MTDLSIHAIQNKFDCFQSTVSSLKFLKHQQYSQILELWSLFKSSIESLLLSICAYDFVETYAYNNIDKLLDAMTSYQKGIDQLQNQFEEDSKREMYSICNHMKKFRQSLSSFKLKNKQETIGVVDRCIDFFIAFMARILDMHTSRALSHRHSTLFHTMSDQVCSQKINYQNSVRYGTKQFAPSENKHLAKKINNSQCMTNKKHTEKQSFFTPADESIILNKFWKRSNQQEKRSSKVVIKELFRIRKQCDCNIYQSTSFKTRTDGPFFRFFFHQFHICLCNRMTIHSRRSHLIPPFSKNTNIFWGDEGLDEILTCQEFLAFHDEVKKKRQNEFDCAPYPNTHYANRKRHSNGSIVYQKEQTHSTLPPLPTMESFMTMMNMPHAPESPCLTARSTSSSVSSSHSTINSLLLDDVSVRLAKVNLDDPSPLLKKNSKEYALSHKTSAPIFSSVATPLPPPPVPPKDFCLLEVASYNPKKSLKCIDTYVDYRHEKPSPVSSRTQSKKRRTAETPKTEKKASRAKSAQRRPPIPPRQSSIPSHEPPKQIGSSQLPLNIPTHHRKPADLDKRKNREDLPTTFGKENSETTGQTRLLDRSKEEHKRTKKSDNKLLKLTENNQVVLLYEMMEGKFQVVAGTPQKLFEKLADEAVQDIEFVDTYLLNHRSFMTSIELLDQLIDRFYLTPIPGEYEYFKKWQSSIQTKVLTVIYRWITISFQDFKNDKKLQKRLDLFRFSDSVKLFQYQSDKINFALEAKDNQLKDAKASSLLDTSHPSSMPQSRRLSETFFSFQSFDALSLTLNSPSLMDISYQNRHNLESSYTTFMSLDTKDIARYLTLADYYLLKSVHEQGIHDQKISTKVDYVQIMTERANMLGHWVAHELCHLNYLKSKRSLVKKWIDIAKTCYDLNNFHTCMVITMGLESTPKLKEVWESLSNKDSSAFALLQKLLDVNMNMRYYRQKTKQVKSPAVPFLPVVLKDYTFLNENPTFLRAYPNLINFSKFIFIKQFTDKTFGLLQESYWFSNELSHFPFLQQDHYQNTEGSLDHVARWIENRLNQIKHCYLHCDLLCRQ